MNFYDLEAKTPQGEAIAFSNFKNKTVLIVNTATRCGFTPQLQGLETLHKEFGEDKLVVLGFPCNQFGGQEPESNDTVEEVCLMNHGVTFQLTEKVEVNGDNEHPVFTYLKDNLGGLLGSKIKWNFTKFLIAPDGKPHKRYGSITKPAKIGKDIEKMVGA